MLMLCWFYCIPFAKFFYFSLSGIILVIAMFMLRRGIYRDRRKLRLWAFLLMFLSALKAFVVDLRITKQYLICDYAPSKKLDIAPFGCDRLGMMLADMLGLGIFLLVCIILLHFFRRHVNDVRKPLTPDQVSLKFWVRLSSILLVGMIIWLSAPWVGYLTVGHVPAIFLSVPWQAFAIINLLLLINGFWRSECCIWNYDLKNRKDSKHLHDSWTPRDALWMNVFLYLIALALSYVAHDILSAHDTQPIVSP